MTAASRPSDPERIRCPLFGGVVDIEVCLACRRLLRVADGERQQVACSVLNDALWRAERTARGDR